MGSKRCYFASANTSDGFVSFFDYVLKDAQRIYIIKGGPGCGKSSFMRKIGEEMLKEHDVDFVSCSADADSLDAIFIKNKNVAIVDGTAPHVIDARYPGAVERIINFGELWNVEYLINNKKDIVYYIDKISEDYKTFYGILKNAKDIHDNLENEYLKGMDFERANEITEDLIKKVITGTANKKAREIHRFAGAMTPQGQVSFYDELTSNIKNRYVVKGRPGSGKSTMSKKIADAALDAGYDVEYYHCAFDPNSLDMIIIPELSFAILDGTAPHVFDPEGADRLIDMFECIDTDIVKESKEPIVEIQGEYLEKINTAKEVYREIKVLHDQLEKFYIFATDFDKVNELKEKVLFEIKNM